MIAFLEIITTTGSLNIVVTKEYANQIKESWTDWLINLQREENSVITINGFFDRYDRGKRQLMIKIESIIGINIGDY